MKDMGIPVADVALLDGNMFLVFQSLYCDAAFTRRGQIYLNVG